MDAFHCVETLKTAIDFYGKPEIFNSDHGSQFTSSDFVTELRAHGILISMDGRGRCLDNAKMERFWWALKYEDIKIKEYVSLPQLRFGVQHYVNFYRSKCAQNYGHYLRKQLIPPFVVHPLRDSMLIAQFTVRHSPFNYRELFPACPLFFSCP